MVYYEKDYEVNCFIALNDSSKYLGSIHLSDDGYSAVIYTEYGDPMEVFKSDIRTVFEIIETAVNHHDTFLGGSTQVFGDSMTKVYLMHFECNGGLVLTTFYKQLYQWVHSYANL